VNEATWPEMMRRMRDGISRNDAYVPGTVKE